MPALSEPTPLISGGRGERPDACGWAEIQPRSGHLVFCPPTIRRQMVAGEDSLTWICIGSALADTDAAWVLVASIGLGPRVAARGQDGQAEMNST